jgi:hypothetical protein
MGAEIFNEDENMSKMFLDGINGLSYDEQLALHIIHRFNICRDTLESMPAFEEHIDLLFKENKEK